MDYTMENFISYCDNYQIANEAFEGIKSKIITLFSKLVLAIEKKVKVMKDSKIKSILLRLLSRAKSGLSKSKSLNERNPEMVKKLQEEANDIQKELNEIKDNADSKEFNKTSDIDNDMKNQLNGVPSTLRSAILNKDVNKARGSFYTIALSDSSFETGKFSETLAIAKRYLPEIMGSDGRTKLETKPENEWNESHWDDVLGALPDDFTMERINYLKKVGRAIYKK